MSPVELCWNITSYVSIIVQLAVAGICLGIFVSPYMQGRWKAVKAGAGYAIFHFYQVKSEMTGFYDVLCFLYYLISVMTILVIIIFFQNWKKPNFFCRENRTGMPDQLKTQIEQLSGYSMDDVRVHYNSDKPAQLQALAYTQGPDIHIAPGQEQHLPHEAWHVVQQKQGRVTPAMQYQRTGINNDDALEHEADVMGKQALCSHLPAGFVQQKTISNTCVQRYVRANLESNGMSVSAVSNGSTSEQLIKKAPATTIMDSFKRKIHPKPTRTQPSRSPLQCAEPKALIQFLASAL